MLTYDAQALARLEKLYSTPQIVEQRKRLRAFIRAQPGETGLDLGCGVAYLACELAREVSPGGRVEAIDASSDAVTASRLRISAQGLDQVVNVGLGDANSLPFPDAHFDFVAAAQVYCYVPDLVGALAEAARVLRPGGRLVVLDTDWDMVAWSSADEALTRRMVQARAAAQFAHAHLPRELPRLLRGAGLETADVQTFSIIETDYQADSFGAGIIASTRDAALKDGVPRVDVDRWVGDMETRRAPGQWFFCLNRFVFVARKP